MKILRLTAVTSLVIASALSLAAGALAKPGLDPTYGQGGTAAVAPLVPVGFNYPVIEEFASAKDGSVYALVRAEAQTCGGYCPSYYLERVGATGAIDPTFGAGGSVALPLTEDGYRISVDAKGRVLAAGLGGSSVKVIRYELAGNPDPSFGTGGTASINCGCEPSSVSVTPARGERVLVVGSATGGGEAKNGPSRISLARLLPNGTLDPTFGVGGLIGYPLGAADPPNTLAVTSHGAILLGSENCCASALETVLRVSAAGKLDTRFDRTAGRALRRLNALGEIRQLTSVVPRPNGTLDLLGAKALSSGFDLRLRANGRLARAFGKRGLVTLKLPVASAALGSNGAIVAASSIPRAFRILRDGSPDPAFGADKGLASGLSGSPVEVGIQSGGRAVLMDVGYHECRSGCASTPGIARFLEGAKR